MGPSWRPGEEAFLEVPAFALAAYRSRAWSEVRHALKHLAPLVVTGGAHGMLFFDFVAGFLAFTLGPASLSSATMASRPLIVLACAPIITVLAPLARRTRS